MQFLAATYRYRRALYTTECGSDQAVRGGEARARALAFGLYAKYLHTNHGTPLVTVSFAAGEAVRSSLLDMSLHLQQLQRSPHPTPPGTAPSPAPAPASKARPADLFCQAEREVVASLERHALPAYCTSRLYADVSMSRIVDILSVGVLGWGYIRDLLRPS
ncbi:hypothetical protein KIPB_015248, partial [Kipferlia bialata]|eukprot:g15248.t1